MSEAYRKACEGADAKGFRLLSKAPRGSNPDVVATWNLFQARYWGGRYGDTSTSWRHLA